MWCWDGHKGLRFDRGISIGAYFLIYTSKIKPVQGELPWNQFFCSELTGVRFMRAKLTKIFYIGNLLYPCSPKGEGDILFLYPRSPRGKGVYCFIIPPLPEGEGGILFYLCPSVQDIFRRIFLSNC